MVKVELSYVGFSVGKAMGVNRFWFARVYQRPLFQTCIAVLTEPSSTSTEPQKRTLPPIEPVYRKKAMSILKKALKKGKVSDNGSSSALANKKHSKQQKNEAKTEAKEKKEQQKESKKEQKLESWLDKKMTSTAKVATSLENLMAKEHAKIAELHKRISEVEQKRNAKQQQLSEMKKMEGGGSKNRIRKKATSLRAKERKLKKLRNEVDVVENKLKQLTSEQSTQGSIQESSQAKTDNRAVSDTNTAIASGSQGPSRITVTPEPRVIMVKPLPTRMESSEDEPNDRAVNNTSMAIVSGTQGPSMITVTPGPRVTTLTPLLTQRDPTLSPRPSTAVRRFLLPPDLTTVTPREQMIRRMMRVEQRAQEEMFEGPRATERPRAAHPFRIRSRTENVQEFLPYELEDFDNDSEDEEPMIVIEDVEAEGMRRFERQQNARTHISTERKWRVRWTTVVDTDSEDDDFEFSQLELTIGSDRPTPSRPTTRCTNGMARQMLDEEEIENTRV